VNVGNSGGSVPPVEPPPTGPRIVDVTGPLAVGESFIIRVVA